MRCSDRMILSVFSSIGSLVAKNHIKRIIVDVKLKVITFQFSSRVTVASLLVFTDLRSSKYPSASESRRDMSVIGADG